MKNMFLLTRASINTWSSHDSSTSNWQILRLVGYYFSNAYCFLNKKSGDMRKFLHSPFNKHLTSELGFIHVLIVTTRVELYQDALWSRSQTFKR